MTDGVIRCPVVRRGKRWPKAKVTLRQGARAVTKNWR
jgi:hypothetical protein